MCAAVVEAHQLDVPAAGQLGVQPPGDLEPGLLVSDDAVDGRSPRALSGSGRAEAEERLDKGAGPRVEDAALNRGERLADEPLDTCERGAELGHVALGGPWQQRGQHELCDERSAVGVRTQ